MTTCTNELFQVTDQRLMTLKDEDLDSNRYTHKEIKNITTGEKRYANRNCHIITKHICIG